MYYSNACPSKSITAEIHEPAVSNVSCQKKIKEHFQVLHTDEENNDWSFGLLNAPVIDTFRLLPDMCNATDIRFDGPLFSSSRDINPSKLHLTQVELQYPLFNILVNEDIYLFVNAWPNLISWIGIPSIDNIPSLSFQHRLQRLDVLKEFCASWPYCVWLSLGCNIPSTRYFDLERWTPATLSFVGSQNKLIT